MRDLDQASALIAAARAAIRVPLSVKMRLGWDDAQRNAATIARVLGITQETCRGYVKSLHCKLGARSQTGSRIT